MPVLYQIKPIVITSTGGNLVQPVGESYTYYNISGSATMVGNLQITPSGTPSTGLTYIFVWKAVLDIITNSTTVTVFGQALTSVQVQKKNVITCTYNGSTWDVDVQTFNTETAFIENSQLGANIVQSSNIANGAITATQIANGSVTLVKLASDSVDSSKIVDGTIQTIDLADNSVTTAKIVDANVTTAKIADANITTAKIADSNITTAKIADGDVTAVKLDSNSVTTVKILDANVTTAKLADDSVTNAKLNTMTASSIKIGDSSGNPQDLPIGLDEIPIGNGTTVTTINKSLLSGGKQVMAIALPISFEAGEQTINRTVWYPTSGTYYLSTVYITVVKAIAGTDNAIIDVNIGAQPDILFNTPNPSSAIIIPASTAMGTSILYSNTSISGADRINPNAPVYAINLDASKVTAGGKVVATIVLHEI